jgi:hypothetical protein
MINAHRAEEITMLSELTNKAVTAINQNQECFCAQWILQNPLENINDYSVCHQFGDDGVQRFWMERKRIAPELREILEAVSRIGEYLGNDIYFNVPQSLILNATKILARDNQRP